MKQVYPLQLKTAFLIVVIMAALQNLSAQCPAGSISNTAGNYNNGQVVCISSSFNQEITLNSGAKMVIVSGGNFTGNINAKSGSTIEVNTGGTFNPNNANSFAAVVTVEKNATVNMNGNFGLSSGFALTNNGTFTWGRSWNQNNYTSITNGACGTMIFTQNTNLTQSAVFNNNGYMLVQGEFNTHQGTSYTNRGRLTVTGNFNVAGYFSNQYQAVFLGGQSNFNNSNDSTINLHTMYFAGKVAGQTRFRNEGLVWIKSDFNWNSNATFLINRPAAQLRVGGKLENNGIMRGTGSLWVNDINNNGTLIGVSTNERLTVNRLPNNGTKTNITHQSDLIAKDTSGYSGGLANPDVCTSSLPMIVSTLQAVYKNNAVQLDWYTVSEINSKQFVIEYSTDGVSFKAGGTVAANGNSNSRINYSYRFTNITGSTMYFRLLLVDLDGSTDYSSIAIVKINGGGQKLVAEAYPNPFTEKVDIQLSLSRKSDIEVKLFDMNGRIVKNQVFSGQSGSNRISLNSLSALRSGIYVLSVVAGEEKWMQKLVK
ncbi:MAG: T9SS type A sorting domain-containing protein [Candidatus Pseudobacter hemicellulosilyticus]|uniref:T9SS type A sorting domain-containing protein n=1 Tax=Candidatus Pseudobacter hemicellulosilyticus TaxID=3121375 RepID=A0AAJ5WML7_9BACT|nr:MAG: T9SS type A sorting domain-containing protein [Pseudobacter sp.]